MNIQILNLAVVRSKGGLKDMVKKSLKLILILGLLFGPSSLLGMRTVGKGVKKVVKTVWDPYTFRNLNKYFKGKKTSVPTKYNISNLYGRSSTISSTTTSASQSTTSLLLFTKPSNAQQDLGNKADEDRWQEQLRNLLDRSPKKPANASNKQTSPEFEEKESDNDTDATEIKNTQKADEAVDNLVTVLENLENPSLNPESLPLKHKKADGSHIITLDTNNPPSEAGQQKLGDLFTNVTKSANFSEQELDKLDEALNRQINGTEDKATYPGEKVVRLKMTDPNSKKSYEIRVEKKLLKEILNKGVESLENNEHQPTAAWDQDTAQKFINSLVYGTEGRFSNVSGLNLLVKNVEPPKVSPLGQVPSKNSQPKQPKKAGNQNGTIHKTTTSNTSAPDIMRDLPKEQAHLDSKPTPSQNNIPAASQPTTSPSTRTVTASPSTTNSSSASAQAPTPSAVPKIEQPTAQISQPAAEGTKPDVTQAAKSEISEDVTKNSTASSFPEIAMKEKNSDMPDMDVPEMPKSIENLFKHFEQEAEVKEKPEIPAQEKLKKTAEFREAQDGLNIKLTPETKPEAPRNLNNTAVRHNLIPEPARNNIDPIDDVIEQKIAEPNKPAQKGKTSAPAPRAKTSLPADLLKDNIKKPEEADLAEDFIKENTKTNKSAPRTKTSTPAPNPSQPKRQTTFIDDLPSQEPQAKNTKPVPQPQQARKPIVVEPVKDNIRQPKVEEPFDLKEDVLKEKADFIDVDFEVKKEGKEGKNKHKANLRERTEKNLKEEMPKREHESAEAQRGKKDNIKVEEQSRRQSKVPKRRAQGSNKPEQRAEKDRIVRDEEMKDYLKEQERKAEKRRASEHVKEAEIVRDAEARKEAKRAKDARPGNAAGVMTPQPFGKQQAMPGTHFVDPTPSSIPPMPKIRVPKSPDNRPDNQPIHTKKSKQPADNPLPSSNYTPPPSTLGYQGSKSSPSSSSPSFDSKSSSDKKSEPIAKSPGTSASPTSAQPTTASNPSNPADNKKNNETKMSGGMIPLSTYSAQSAGRNFDTITHTSGNKNTGKSSIPVRAVSIIGFLISLLALLIGIIRKIKGSFTAI
jgi:hypothetical protein